MRTLRVNLMKINPETPKEPLSLRVPREVKTALKRMARQHGKKVGRYVEDVLREHVAAAA